MIRLRVTYVPPIVEPSRRSHTLMLLSYEDTMNVLNVGKIVSVGAV